MKVLNINNNNNSKHPSFKAKIDEINPIAEKLLLKLDKRFKKVLEGTSTELKEIKFENQQVKLNIWGYNGSDSIEIISRLTQKPKYWGTAPFNVKLSKESFESFITAVNLATEDIGKRPNYLITALSKAMKKINEEPIEGLRIIEFNESAKEALSLLGKDFAYDIKNNADKIRKITANGLPVKIRLGGCGSEGNLGISATFEKTSQPFGYSEFFHEKQNGKINDIDGFISSITQAVKNLEDRQNNLTSRKKSKINK